MDKNNACVGQCRLDFVDGTTLRLSRKDGAYLPLKITTWQAKLIPAVGVDLSNAGADPDTNYYIYAFDSAGTLTLEYSVDAYEIDADVGIMIRMATPSRTLVGFARTDGAGEWQVQGLGTLSWFNRKAVRVQNQNTGYGSVAGDFPAGSEVDSDFRQHFVSWADDRPLAFINTSAGSNGAANNMVAMAHDTAVIEEQYCGSGTAYFGQTGIVASVPGDETDHYITIFAGSSTTIYINGNQTANQGMTQTVAVVVQG